MKAAEMLGRTGALALLAGLAGCGGGGVASTPAPVVPITPASTPTPTPTPTPTATNYDTSEYRRSDGPSLHGAITAWQSGASGVGATIAIVDSGIDTANTEFAGRIAATSRDVVGFRSLSNAEDDHGTQVALVAAAARNDSGIVGMAWNATVQMLRADTPGTCNASDGCTFADANIAAGIDAAVSAGARVINLSLGGDPANAALRTSIARAASSGAVIVVSAGNDGDSTSAGVDPTNPDPFAASVLQAGGANVIIVGSVDDAGVISDFSNRPGTSAASTLMALGERVCCVYEGSVPKTTTGADGTFVTVVSGTSFAAPQVSGAVALLAEAFPNLTGAQIVDLLLSSARDAGSTGTDAVYGRGLLDIARAFSPQGSTSLAGTQVAVSLAALSGTTSAAMGDAISGTSLGTVMLDGYGRAYRMDLASGLRASSVRQPLFEALASRGRPVALDAADFSLAFTVDHRFGTVPLRLAPGERQQARVLASSVVTRIDRSLDMALGWKVSAESLTARLQQRRASDFLVAGMSSGVLARPETGVAARYRLGRLGLTASVERSVLVRSDPLRERRGYRMTQFGMALDGGQDGTFDWRLGLGLMREERTVLGTRFADALGGGGATTATLSPGFGWRFGRGWALGATGGLGFTRIDSGAVVSSGSRLVSSSWSVDLSREGVLTGGDRLAFRLSQPLRVERGGLDLNLPVAWDYATESATFARVPLSLAPKGRELDAELAWATVLWGGDASASVFFRKEPGHFAGAADNGGFALRWSRGF
ncbi:S8 family serine peptidase [Novosphingobium sp. ERN07]|uniref:S8 family peptidase n=1 Tax=Novosphingobium sp. ERN07 TaxID=2726187 RepID=UPI001457863C|nr:S8 family peptidase [Novosphingobium sp. ERN07]NLR69901.1 S8 family serine peptidase [Novosphingobium sp. ERN07]